MSLFDIYKAKQLGMDQDSLFVSQLGKSMGENYEELDLGTLSWYYSSSSGHERMYSSVKSEIKPAADVSSIANFKCEKYTPASSNDTYFHTQDKILAVGTDSRVYVYDSDFTNASEFKTAMSGVILKYEPVA